MGNCFNCGSTLNSATRTDPRFLNDTEPRIGDIAICFYCGHVMIFTGEELREPTSEEMVEIADNEELINAQRLRRR